MGPCDGVIVDVKMVAMPTPCCDGYHSPSRCSSSNSSTACSDMGVTSAEVLILHDKALILMVMSTIALQNSALSDMVGKGWFGLRAYRFLCVVDMWLCCLQESRVWPFDLRVGLVAGLGCN